MMRAELTSIGDELVVVPAAQQQVDAIAVANGVRRSVVNLATNEPKIFRAAVSPDGRLLATAHDDFVVRVYNFRRRNIELARLAARDDIVRTLVFSSDGQTLVGATATGNVSLWHVPTWQELATFKSQIDAISFLSFSTGGDILAIGGRSPSGKGQMVLWETRRTTN
jgi:WD40 repeat protein